MKDSIITARRKRTELITLLACFIIANVVNAGAIIAYKTCFTELFTQIGYVILFAIVLYVLWSLLRMVYYLTKKLLNTKKQKRQS